MIATYADTHPPSGESEPRLARRLAKQNSATVARPGIAHRGDVGDDLRRWQLALGAAFSLWRAVFLAWPDDLARTFDVTKPDSLVFLRKVIDTNAIAFSDDVTARHWASGYYLNNARYRLERLLGDGTLRTVI